MPLDTGSSTQPETQKSKVLAHVFAGLCASLISIGLARFAYTPLIPSLIQAHWFSSADVIYLSAANLAGYLIGAMLGRPIASRLPNEHSLRLMMLLVTVSFAACAVPLSAIWFFAWRLLSGVAGGAIMVLVAATVLPHVPPVRRGLASGAIFLGVGLGIAGSGTLVPLLLQIGLPATWIGLAAVSAILTAASWFAWPSSRHAAAMPAATPDASTHRYVGPAITVLYGQYALMAVGLVPSMVFLVDFIARGLGAGMHLGSIFWILYGVGAIFGPPCYGLLADRISPRPALRLVLLVQLMALACLCVIRNHVLLALLTIVLGTFPPGMVPLILARVRESTPHDVHRQNVVWSRATMVFAAFQALAGYGYSAVFNASGGKHPLLFLIAAIALLFALLADCGLRAARSAQ